MRAPPHSPAEFTRLFPGFPVLDDGQQVRYPIHVADVADALAVAARSNRQVDGRVFELAGPRAYTYRRLVELFAYAAFTPCRIVSLSPYSFWSARRRRCAHPRRLYGKIFPDLRQAPFPLDCIRQLLESEAPDAQHASAADLGLARLERLEDHMVHIARRYRRTADYGQPVVFPAPLLADSVAV